MKENYYYDVMKDIEAYPEALFYLVWGGRNTGKTYSALKFCVQEKKQFIFIKRTKVDVDILCMGTTASKKTEKLKNVDMDVSPFMPLNRDLGWNIRAFKIIEGFGIFVECDPEGNAIGEPVGFIVALSAVKDVKGFSMPNVQYMIYDEFVPKIWERTAVKDEGTAYMDLYKSVARDREHRGMKPLTNILLANADNIASPMAVTLEVIDDLTNMIRENQHTYYNKERLIFMNKLETSESFREKEAQSRIYKTMAGTKWAQMALDNDFAYNDLSNVGGFDNLKGFKPVFKLIYNQKEYIGYEHPEKGFYITDTKTNNKIECYDLRKDNDVKAFYLNWVQPLKLAAVDDMVKYKFYSIYELIINYNKKFKM